MALETRPSPSIVLSSISLLPQWSLGHNAILKISLKVDQHCQEVAGIGAMASFTAGFACRKWLICPHAPCRIGLSRVRCVWHAMAWEAIGATGLLICRDGVTLHVAMDGLGIRG